MARTMLNGLFGSNLVCPDDVTVSDVNQAGLESIKAEYGVNTTGNNVQAVGNSDLVVLAVKPQNLSVISAELAGKLEPNQLIVSILAGINLGKLSQNLEHNAIVRAMPNTPAQIGMGMTVWTSSAAVTNEQKETAQNIFLAMGEALYIEDEEFIDLATAISGSGPAYFFLFMEAMVDAAVKSGFTKETATRLVLQTALGSVNYARLSDKGLAELRQQVTSPGGTTAAAIQVFEAENFKSVVAKAVACAHQRAKEIGR